MRIVLGSIEEGSETVFVKEQLSDHREIYFVPMFELWPFTQNTVVVSHLCELLQRSFASLS